MKRWLVGFALSLLVSSLAVGAWFVRQAALEEIEKERKADMQIGRRAPTVMVAGERALLLEKAESEGVACEAASSAEGGAEEEAPGEIVLAQGGTHDVRAPFAGLVGQGARSPVLGAEIARDERVFSLTPQMSPDARFDLALKRVAAEADQEKARAELDTAEKAFARDELLVRDGSVAPRVRDESRTRVASARASLAEAERRTASLMALEQRSGFEEAAIAAPVTGIVSKLEVAPGARVQAGDLLFVQDEQGTLRARVDLAPGLHAREHPPERATIVFPALGNQERGARLASIDPRVKPATLALSALYELDPGPAPRPGEPIVARLASGAKEPCARIPASALLVRDGESWIYVRVAPSTFARRSVLVLARSGDSVLVKGKVHAADAVVARGSFVLLAEELKPLIVVESEGGAADEEAAGGRR